MERLFFVLASLEGGLAVVLGAFGTHALKARIESELLEVFETGVRYQMYHALALLAVAAALARWPASRVLTTAGWSFVIGVALFSGSLYLLALTGVRWFGAITPLGGLGFIVGWLCMSLAAWKK
ncbi:MAG: DUF423 domain-containing protein [Deltaproteobacteria bacterium]|nr:MAG: DUF423 domain-containing protein [Deltaproteobacteria bacterium]